MDISTRPQSQQEIHPIQVGIVTTYRIAIIAAFTCIFIGLFLAFTNGDDVATELGNVGDIADHLRHGDPEGFFGVGIGLIVFAPTVMLLGTIVGFLKIGDKRYAGIALAVTVILLLSIGAAAIV